MVQTRIGASPVAPDRGPALDAQPTCSRRRASPRETLPEAREVLSDWEGAASRHWLLAYHEGDWERCVVLLRKEFDCARAAGQLSDVAAFGSALGRIARIGNQRVDAEAILDESLQASLTSPDLPVGALHSYRAGHHQFRSRAVPTGQGGTSAV